MINSVLEDEEKNKIKEKENLEEIPNAKEKIDNQIKEESKEKQINSLVDIKDSIYYLINEKDAITNIDLKLCILSIISEYFKKNPELLNPESLPYKLVYSFYDYPNDLDEALKKYDTIYFPLSMEGLDKTLVYNFLKEIIIFFFEDEEFANEVFEQYKSYNFINDYKQEMNNFIDEEFKKIIGLNNIKEDLKDMVILISNNMIRRQNDMNEISISMHMVFTGNPGCGKTTIARLIGQMYYKLGIIKSEKFIEVSRSDLVAEYVGQTAIKTSKVLEEAKDGILFIDEAYSLASSSQNDYGKESIETILKFMEDNRDNTIIIVAGYEKEMINFINSNPGLKSRFNKFFKFNNYTNDELYQIFKVFTSKGNYIIDDDDEEVIKERFNKIDTNSSNFSNARYIRNIYDKTILNQAKRVDKEKITDKDKFITIKNEDIEI